MLRPDEMDKKLLLAIQSCCNADGVKVPWEKVGRVMGDKISDGAVIQHLAKLRSRMVKQGLSVPPPLKRGGGNIISTGNSNGSAKVAVTTQGGKLSGLAHGTHEDGEEEYDADKATDMDEEYGQPPSKRAKRGKQDDAAGKAASKPKGKVGIKVEESEGTEGSSVDQKETQEVMSKKRKRQMKKTGLGKGKGLPKGKGFSPNTRPRRSSVDYAELNGGYDTEDNYDSAEGEEYVGAAAPYMKFAESPVSDDDEVKDNKQHVELSESAAPSKVVVLQVGTANLLEETKRMEMGTAIKSEHSSESDEGSDVEQVELMEQQLADTEPSIGHYEAFGPAYANQNPTVHQQYNTTAPVYGGFTPAANGPFTVGYGYTPSATNNNNWFQGPGYTHSSFNANTVPGSFVRPLATTRVTIPQQANGPNVDMIPSATSTYSDRTPAVMGDQYYVALDEGMDGMDAFTQAYNDPTTQDPAFGPDGGFGYFDF